MGSHPLSVHNWYHGAISRDEAEYRLWSTGPVDGCWLVRGSQSLDNRLCLSLWAGGTISRFFHIIIPVNRSGGFYLDSPAMGFASMADLLFFYAETKRGFITQTGDMVYLLSPCPRPPPPTPMAGADSNYCSTIPVESGPFGLEVAPSSPVLAAKCMQSFTSPVAAALLEVSMASPDPAVTTMSGFGARLEKAIQHAQMVQCAVESENGIADVEEFEVVDLSRPRNADSRPSQQSATQLRRRTRRQSGLQRHNAGDNQPILLRKSPEDRKKDKAHHTGSVFRKFGSSIVHLFCMIFLIRSATEHAHESSQPRHPRKSKDHKGMPTNKVALTGAMPAPLPGGNQVIDVTGEGQQRRRVDKAELGSKPIVYADDVAGILRAIHDKRMQSQAPPIAVPTPAMQPNAVVTV